MQRYATVYNVFYSLQMSYYDVATPPHLLWMQFHCFNVYSEYLKYFGGIMRDFQNPSRHSPKFPPLYNSTDFSKETAHVNKITTGDCTEAFEHSSPEVSLQKWDIGHRISDLLKIYIFPC